MQVVHLVMFQRNYECLEDTEYTDDVNEVCGRSLFFYHITCVNEGAINFSKLLFKPGGGGY